MRCAVTTVSGMLLAVTLILPAASKAVETAEIVRHLIPLPKEIRIERSVTVPAEKVAITLLSGAGETALCAANELRSIFPGSATVDGDPAFEIVIGTLDSDGMLGDIRLTAEAERLSALPNSDQAYIIRPVGPSRIALAGLSETGVYYAVQTMKQLLAGAFDNGIAELPVVTVTDWPDLAYRGAWDDTFPPEQIEWFASLKMNRVDCHADMRVDESGRGTVGDFPRKGPVSVDGVDYPLFCRRHAVDCVPILKHLSHLERTGIYKVYPHLVGKGIPPDDRFIPPCAKQEDFIRVLADWMAAYAGRPGVREISAWLGEVEQQCDCEECRAAGQYVMETRALVEAYRRVRATYPGLRLRILTTQGSYPVNDKVLAELPDDVGVIYYHGEKTYDSSREPMIYFDLREQAARGRKVGVCPQMTVSWAVVCPWSSPQFVRTRMNEYADKRIDLVSLYATPDIRLYEFNMTAAAEWSWNAKGRDEREFAFAWAERKGYDDPEAFAQWAVLHGDVSWDVYGSGIPYAFVPGFGTADRMIANRIPPVPGEGMFRYFPTAQHFDLALATCDRTLDLAFGLNDPHFIEETRAVRGYIRMTRDLYRIMSIISKAETLADDDKTILRENIRSLTDACMETNAALLRWADLFEEGLGGGRFTGTLKLTEDTVTHVDAVLDTLGCGQSPRRISSRRGRTVVGRRFQRFR